MLSTILAVSRWHMLWCMDMTDVWQRHAAVPGLVIQKGIVALSWVVVRLTAYATGSLQGRCVVLTCHVSFSRPHSPLRDAELTVALNVIRLTCQGRSITTPREYS